jgi:hypothetical protein
VFNANINSISAILWHLYSGTEYIYIFKLNLMVKFIFVTDFSISDWADKVGADVGQQISSQFRQLLIEQLGLDVLLKKPQCDRNSSLYTPAIGGWKNGVLILFYQMWLFL